MAQTGCARSCLGPLKFSNFYLALNLAAFTVHLVLASWGFSTLVNKDNTLTVYRDVMVRRSANETISCDDCAADGWRNQTVVF